GILIAGSAATGNAIQADVIGTDPTGTQALPNGFGVQIRDGAHDSLVGGTAAEGNLIVFNDGPGVDVEGAGSLGNRINANRIFANESTPQGTLQFEGASYVTLPDNLINGFGQNETIEAWFQTTSGGAILGYQTGDPATF